MNTELAKNETNAIAHHNHERPGWIGESLATDRKIPRLLLMQALSTFVNDDKAVAGDIVKSTTIEKVGDLKNPIEMIILSYPQKQWAIKIKKDGKQKTVEKFNRTAANESLAWKFTSNDKGEEVPEGKHTFEANRVRTASFFAILPADLERYTKEMEKAVKGDFPDLSVRLTPVQVYCQGYSHEAACDIEEFLRTVARFKREPWEAVVELSAKDMKNEKGKWYVFTFDTKKTPKPTPAKYRDAAKQAFDAVQQYGHTLEVDEAEEESSETAPLSANSAF